MTLRKPSSGTLCVHVLVWINPGIETSIYAVYVCVFLSLCLFTVSSVQPGVWPTLARCLGPYPMATEMYVHWLVHTHVHTNHNKSPLIQTIRLVLAVSGWWPHPALAARWSVSGPMLMTLISFRAVSASEYHCTSTKGSTCIVFCTRDYDDQELLILQGAL